MIAGAAQRPMTVMRTLSLHMLRYTPCAINLVRVRGELEYALDGSRMQASAANTYAAMQPDVTLLISPLSTHTLPTVVTWLGYGPHDRMSEFDV